MANKILPHGAIIDTVNSALSAPGRYASALVAETGGSANCRATVYSGSVSATNRVLFVAAVPASGSILIDLHGMELSSCIMTKGGSGTPQVTLIRAVR